ncbi:MAG: substrate-binding domain-containing protein, partial [Pseudomonas sp.]
ALYCAKGHPLFTRKKVTLEELREQDGVKYPYRFQQADDPWQAEVSSARSEQVEGTLAFVLSGAHLGYLPTHVAAPWVAAGQLRALLPEQLAFNVSFYLGSHRGRQPSEAQKAFVTDLLAAFAG